MSKSKNPKPLESKKGKLARQLKEISRNYAGDPEHAHVEADEALLSFIDDHEVTEAFNDIKKWYA